MILKFDGWTPKKWTKLSANQQIQTVAHFVGGYKHILKDREIQVWSEVSDGEGGYHFEGSDNPDAKFVIEYFEDNSLSENKYVVTEKEVKDYVKQLLEEHKQ